MDDSAGNRETRVAVKSGRGDASEVAQAVAELVRDHQAVSEDATRDLRRLLGHDLAARSAGQLRLGHLRLLIELVSNYDGPDPFVTSTTYQEEVERRRTLGEDYPDESTLRAAYGHWLKAVRAAARFLNDGGPARVKHSYRYARVQTTYDTKEILTAFTRCRRELGDWPTEWEFHEWAELKRMLARENPRVPNPRSIRKAFGSFDAAVELAQGIWERGQGGNAGTGKQ